MNRERRWLRCAVYTRVSTDHGLEQEFNSLDAQREVARAYIKSQAHEGWTLLRDSYDDGGFSGGSLDRPALQLLLAAIRARRVDVVVVYKVDRLTRSLADFAKQVELFDAHGVSFVSVTQSFNTTTSMGRLTLNVLLSFAQFEREVTSERIRDKIAASKRRGLWVGGPVPLGYAVRAKKLMVVEEEAERVRLIFRLYLELGSLGRLLPELCRRGVLTRRRELADGKVSGGIPFARGPLAHLLRNRCYLGEVVFRGKAHPGEHAAIIEPELFRAVQERFARQHHGFVRARVGSEALLLGRLFDDCGNRMSPTHANKQGVRYRYYVSCALAQGRPEAAGSVTRVAAAQVEQPVLQALRQCRPVLAAAPDRELIEQCVDRVVIDSDTIAITLRGGVSGSEHEQRDSTDDEASAETAVAKSVLRIAWAPIHSRRRREVILPAQAEVPDQRPIRAETRATLVRAIASAAVGSMSSLQAPSPIPQRSPAARAAASATWNGPSPWRSWHPISSRLPSRVDCPAASGFAPDRPAVRVAAPMADARLAAIGSHMRRRTAFFLMVGICLADHG